VYRALPGTLGVEAFPEVNICPGYEVSRLFHPSASA
jgi:hypothetical protein